MFAHPLGKVHGRDETPEVQEREELHAPGTDVSWVFQGPVEEVIAKAGPVCGVGTYPRYWVNDPNTNSDQDSDYYFLRSPHGVWIIYRRSQSEKYEIMQPGLMRTWYHAMLAVGTWLWPSPPQQLGNHILRYEMWSYRNTERPEVIVKFNELTGTGSYPGQSFPADSKFEPLRGKLLTLAEES